MSEAPPNFVPYNSVGLLQQARGKQRKTVKRKRRESTKNLKKKDRSLAVCF